MLHVVSGDGAAAAVSRLGLEGEVLVWREALAMGPVERQPHGDDFYASRAAFLGADASSLRRQRDQLLSDLEQGSEAVLWFGRDLFCQVNLAALARGLIDAGYGQARVAAVLPSGDSARCLNGGPSDFASWFEERVRVAPFELAALAGIWDLYAASEPTALVDACTATSLGVSHRALTQAMAVHAARFPDASGLGLDEREILGLCQSPTSFAELFSSFSKNRAELGWGDRQVEHIIDDLAALPDPALRSNDRTIEITQRGRDALRASLGLRADGNSRPRSLGGVSLGPGRLDWRWDGRSLLALRG